VACAGLPSIYIRKRGRDRWTMADHSRAIRTRQAAAPIDVKSGTFASIVKRCEVAFLYDRGFYGTIVRALHIADAERPQSSRGQGQGCGGGRGVRLLLPRCAVVVAKHPSGIRLLQIL
jgi:hypothetical protein